MTKFKVGQFVRVTAVRHFAYGRIARVLTGGKIRTQVRFADLPPLVDASVNPSGFVETFSNMDLKRIEDVPIASFYLLVRIVERNGEQNYTQDCLAHGGGDRPQDSPEEVAEAIAANWYPEGGDWDETKNAYVFYSDYLLTASIESCKQITVAQYITFRDVLSDCTPE
jgi:hypothetical protein